MTSLTEEQYQAKIRELEKEVKKLNLIIQKDSKTKYGLRWIDVPEAFEKDSENKIPILEEAKDKAIKNDDGKPTHILIEGDNYHALKCLNYTHKGKIDVIYIDPPYNTGSDGFTYKDKRFLSQFPDGTTIPKEHPLRHSTWLSFMSKRLELAKNLLSEKGVIFISIDDNEQANLKLLCDQIFGEDNFVNVVTVKTKIGGVSGSSEGKSLKGATEYLFIYAKNQNYFLLNPVYIKTKLSQKIQEYKDTDKSWKYTSVLTKLEGKVLLKEDSERKMKYYGYRKVESMSITAFAKENKLSEEEVYDQYADKIFRTTNAQSSIRQTVLSETEQFDYEMIGLEYNPIKGKNFGKTIEVLYKGDQRNMMMFLSDTVRRIDGTYYYLDKISTLWVDILYNNISKEGGVEYNNGKKPLQLVNRCIELASSNTSTILDFFAGSGTTLHATIMQNLVDNGTRQCILVQQNEKKGKICETKTFVRCKNVMVENGNSLKYYRTAFVGENEAEYATDKDKIILSKKAGCLLSMAENTLEEYISTDRYQIFGDDKNSFTGIYFSANADKISEFTAKLEQLRNLSLLNEINAYFFSSGDGTEFSDEFESRKNIKIKSIPEPILEVYRRLN